MSTIKKAVVFGGAGFIGSHVSDNLTKEGFAVTVYDIRPSKYIMPRQTMMVGDITDSEKVKKAIKGASVVYNFAGISGIDEASKNPLATIQYNILGNAIILDALRKEKINRYLFASTVYVYSDVGSFYRDSKLACELYIYDYHKTYGIPYTILRFGSIYGTRNNQNDRISLFLHQALTKGEMTYSGDGEEIREYIHVEDAARCSVEILDKKYCNKNIILSGQHSMKVKDLMVMIKEILKKDIKIKLLGNNSEVHYEITPYAFHPKLGSKYISCQYIDLGEGILQCAEGLFNSLQKNKTT